MSALDSLRALRGDLARRVSVIDRLTEFVAALAAECGVEAEVSEDDGDLILVIPQMVARDPVAVVAAEGLASARRDPPPEAAPAEAPAVASPEVDAAPEAAAPPDRTGEAWTPDEDARLLALFRAGRTGKQVAAELGRSVRAIWVRKNVLVARGARATPEPAPENSPDHSPPSAKPAAAAPAPSLAPPPAPGGTPFWLRELRAHLDALGHAAPWTPELDLRLAEGLVAGRRLTDLAQVLGVTPDAARGRWRRLLPESGIDAQARLLAELRARAGAAQAGVAAE